ncbi:MAG: beta-ketoacyl synthase [Oleibacter sp.]|nr:beta-ketoacyl synthase [Thalassolituus sp.]
MANSNTDIIIASVGGINAAGRSSDHLAFRRIVFEALSPEEQTRTVNDLNTLTGAQATANTESSPLSVNESATTSVLNDCLVRAWDDNCNSLRGWHPDAMPFYKQHEQIETEIQNPLKDNGITSTSEKLWQTSSYRCDVQSAGQIPKGFDVASLYNSRNHPRGLQLSLYAAADALGNLGLSADDIKQTLAPDDIAVYMGSTAGQLDAEGFGGMITAPYLGQRNSSRQLPMGISTMPADFINAYLLGNAGSTGSNNGACASFLYNLRLAQDDIRSGRRKLVLVGNSEAPLIPAIVEGFNAMKALATEARLRAVDKLSPEDKVDFTRASRPFAENVGFTLAESAQCFVLADRTTALELGLNILGSVGDVFIHADGHKHSISAPGIGNYITLGKAMASAARELGHEALKRSMVQAHGSSTPQNRVTESDMLNRFAQIHDIAHWPIVAAKTHLGHSISAASADQLLITLGSWQYGLLPGITTAQAIANDVHQSQLSIGLKHTQVDPKVIALAFINSKGFGGNNATAWVLSGQATTERIQRRISPQAWQDYLLKNEHVKENQTSYLASMAKGNLPLPYKDKEPLPDPCDIELTAHGMILPGWKERVEF